MEVQVSLKHFIAVRFSFWEQFFGVVENISDFESGVPGLNPGRITKWCLKH